MFSTKFHRTIIITKHARLRMFERKVADHLLAQIIDLGETRYSDDTHLWAFKEFPIRSDNSLCAVLVIEEALIVKTVMHHFSVR
jgi:hypothetical protein